MTGGREPDRGESLVELLMAISIMGIAFVGLVGSLGSAITLSVVHRSSAVTETALRSVTESLQDAATTYVPCAPDYAVSGGAGYTADVVTVRHWTGSAFAAAGSPCVLDGGAQLLTVRVSSTDTRVSARTLQVVKRG